MDWSTKGPEFEVVEALDEWERELEQAASQEASAAPTPQPCQVEQPNEAKRSRSCASRTGGKFMRWWLLVSALLLAIVLVVWGCLAWPGERPEGAQQPAAGTRQPGELSRLAETLGVATSGSKENLEAQCAEKLKALFVWPEDRLPGTPREQVEVALRQFVGWTEKDPEADRLSLAQLVASNTTLARLERMFPKENGNRFDASGLLEYRDLRRWLAGVDRPWLQEFGRALQDYSGAVAPHLEVIREDKEYGELICSLHSAVEKSHVKSLAPEGRRPAARFFLAGPNGDVDWIRDLQDLTRETNLRSWTGKDVPHDTLKDWLHDFAKRYQNNNPERGRPYNESRKGLEARMVNYHQLDKSGEKKAIEALITLFNTWCELLEKLSPRPW